MSSPRIEYVAEHDRYVYHYTNAATASEHILENRTLRLGRYSETNDPKERKSWRFDLGTNGDADLGSYSMEEESKWLSHELKHRARLACFSMDSGPLSGNHLEEIHRRGFCKPRMWAQYADQHRGVCLVFDKDRLSNRIDMILGSDQTSMSGPVRYIDRSITPDMHEPQPFAINVDILESAGREIYPELHLRNFHRELFFEKMTDWQNEAEWRWIVYSTAEDDVNVDFDDALVALIFGDETAEDAMDAMMTRTRSWSIQYLGLTWKNSSPWYDYANHRYHAARLEQ